MEVIKQDCLFFEKNDINDYSLLIGVHNIAPENTTRQNIVLDNSIKASSASPLIVRSNTIHRISLVE